MAMSTHRSSDSPPLVITTSTADPRCHWSDDDELVLINFLLDHIAEAGDGGSFKPNIWNAAAVKMLKHTAKGGPNIARKCKAKYVSLREEHSVSNEDGLNVSVDEMNTWKIYLTAHPRAKPFSNKGFPLYDQMVPLMPSLTKGTHAFWPSQQTIGVGINEPAVPVDHGSMGPPELPNDSDKELPPQSTPPQQTSAALSSTTASITSSHKCKHAALVSVSESLRSSSFRSGPSEKKQRGSGVAVLSGIKDSIDEFKTIMHSGMPVAQVHAAD
ncbi:hypothetical protein PILCRDRAFT_9617 [Piloderma croceum F 1598]|uniref:Myb-like domain-containing protein n=1 Tax=Piloderma croceum (strain F 1598) TaxID=765440 RepID=A0A0C3BSV1_PILCF|nr:hypothetical protein PILCRDRAFT_9617 [Piloderma croceum F 1598]